jgi:hypothetical protein
MPRDGSLILSELAGRRSHERLLTVRPARGATTVGS